MRLTKGLLAALLITLAGWAQALSPELALRIADGDNDERIAAIGEAVATGSERLPLYLQAMLDDEVRVAGGRAVIVQGDAAVDAASGEARPLPADAEDVRINNRLRQAIGAALAAARLASPDARERGAAITALKGAVDEAMLPLLQQAAARETVPALQLRLQQLVAAASIEASDTAVRLQAAQALAGSGDPAMRSLLLEKLPAESDPAVKAAMQASLQAIQGRLAWGERLGVLFTGISLGSILLLVALGLAITYGLMGVINMAHGELMMIGAYATYVVQNLFRQHLPGVFDAYILAAIPASFLAAAAVGAVLERSVIRWLYGRPLETLLATWGISLILMQTVRTVFGAQNVAVENPSWLSGGLQVLPNLTLPYNRLAILVFAALVLLGMALLIGRTRLGLFVRGVTQNRRMARCVGVNTARVDTYAFALGAGIAGLAGCALSQVGNVGPDLGQGYIVDAFMVVVLGGVGQLAGTVYAGLGLGIVNKLLEGWQGAVLAKIMVLVMIVLFIQKRPQGLFAMKGRSAEA